METNYSREPPGDYLAHYGVKGTHWYQHLQGKWQNQAMYAVGDQRHSDGTPLREKIIGSRDARQGAYAAENDYRIQMIERGSVKDAAIFAAKNLTLVSALATPIGGAAYSNMKLNEAIDGYRKRHHKEVYDKKLGVNKQIMATTETAFTIGNTKNRYESNRKKMNTNLSDVYRAKVSKEYEEAYSKRMQALINSADHQTKIKRLREKYKNKPTKGGDMGIGAKTNIAYSAFAGILLSAGIHSTMRTIIDVPISSVVKIY